MLHKGVGELDCCEVFLLFLLFLQNDDSVVDFSEHILNLLRLPLTVAFSQEKVALPLDDVVADGAEEEA